MEAERTGAFAGSAMDALPMRIAIVDRDGVIVQTNRRWREFAADSGIDDPAMIGVDYLEASARGYESTPEAVAGIERVLAGETTVYTQEYPCETPQGERWFLLRAAPFVRDGERYASIAHIDITQRKREEQRLDALVSRVGGVLTETGRRVAAAETVADIYERLARSLSRADPYRAAWTMRRTQQFDALTLAAVGGRLDPDDVDDVDIAATHTSDPVTTAFETGEPVLVRPRDDRYELHTAASERVGRTGELYLPIHHGQHRYGILGVAVALGSLSPSIEESALSAVARIAGQAIHEIDQRELLYDDRLVDIRYAGRPSNEPVLALAERTGAEFDLLDVLSDDGALVQVFEISTGNVDAIRQAARDDPAVSDVSIVRTTGPPVIEARIDESFVEVVAELGGTVDEYRVGPRRFEARVGVHSRHKARFLHDELRDQYPGLQLQRKRERRASASQRESIDDGADLTERQSTALRTAFHAGFFDEPRETDGDELAATMDITRQTFHQHLRAAQRKVFEAMLDAPDEPGLESGVR